MKLSELWSVDDARKSENAADLQAKRAAWNAGDYRLAGRLMRRILDRNRRAGVQPPAIGIAERLRRAAERVKARERAA